MAKPRVRSKRMTACGWKNAFADLQVRRSSQLQNILARNATRHAMQQNNLASDGYLQCCLYISRYVRNSRVSCNNLLTFQLKRFSHAKDKSSKLDMPVSFPLYLDMAPYTTSYKTDAKKVSKSEIYRLENSISISYTLSAVIVHKGGIESGHYVSYSREGTDWFLFDDSKVVLVSESEVLNAEAYLLLYAVETVERE